MLRKLDFVDTPLGTRKEGGAKTGPTKSPDLDTCVCVCVCVGGGRKHRIKIKRGGILIYKVHGGKYHYCLLPAAFRRFKFEVKYREWEAIGDS